MENIFRGYPQALYAMQVSGPLCEPARRPIQPYMLYRREDRPARTWDTDPGCRRREAEYFRGLYPAAVRKQQNLIEEVCDGMDYAGSPIYDEYPDRETIYRMRDSVVERACKCGAIKEQDKAKETDLILILLVCEIHRRRVIRQY